MSNGLRSAPVGSDARSHFKERHADCLLEDVRGHGLVRKLSKVSRPQIDFVRWSDNYLTKGLTLLSDPTEDYSTVICPTLTKPLEQRKAARDRLLG